MKILVVNAGSSTCKLALFQMETDDPVEPLWKGAIDWGRKDQPISLKAKNQQGARFEKDLEDQDIEKGIQTLLNSLWQGPTQVIDNLSVIQIIGHRVVHGGDRFVQPVRIDQAVKDAIHRLIPLAPLHNPINLQGIEWMEKLFSGIEQIAVFDTAFHATMPEIVKTYPVPWEWKEKGIQRYGFHGISHQYCADRAVKLLKSSPQDVKMINCHLGNGCSLCAIQNGKSYDTTMGFTPLEGVMMGTRCGSIDPGILLYLLRETQISLKELDHTLNFSSGLKGIGGSSDMRDLLNQKNDERARLAVEMFVQHLKTAIGALAVSLSGFNVLCFTAGIGENSPSIRQAVCEGLECLNVVMDEAKNSKCRPDENVTGPSSKVQVLVLETREEWMIARACRVLYESH